MLDWQNIVVGLIVFAASAYTARRVWRRVRSFNSNAKNRDLASSCVSECCGCSVMKQASVLNPARSLKQRRGRITARM